MSVATQSGQDKDEVIRELPVIEIPKGADSEERPTIAPQQSNLEVEVTRKQPVNQTPQSTSKDEHPMIAPKPTKLNRNSGRNAKGVDNPVVQYNKYGVLDSPEAMQTDDRPPIKQTKKNDTGTKDKSIEKTKHPS
jgi:hypothetical protein